MHKDSALFGDFDLEIQIKIGIFVQNIKMIIG